MKQYIIRRVLISIIVLFGVSIMLYTLTRLMPSDFVDLSTSGNIKITEEQKNHLRELYGLDKGIIEGYFSWVNDVFHGDLGTSLTYKKPVVDIIKQYAPITFIVAGISLVLQFIVAVPLGILAARKQYSKTDYTIVIATFIGISLPIFFFAVVLKSVFSDWLDILPASGMLTARRNYDGFTFAKLLDYAKHLILPISCFVITSVGGLLRYTRTNMLEVLNMDYVRTARAKGVSESKVINKHAFRNTLIPIVTMVGGMLPGLFSGAAITEGLFALEGLGNLALKASYSADIPYLMGFNMFLAVLTLAGTLLSDILYAVVDPRVRYS
ncbi:MAG: diguanylate cyclase [Clostridiales bacterium GWF2_38_85]|nr:MAG: diguanylate cyclase [Clostridiales bacterium GWF2_38_85]HBL84761.1 diguanylate cyclase [Clostridiales bacterium]